MRPADTSFTVDKDEDDIYVRFANTALEIFIYKKNFGAHVVYSANFFFNNHQNGVSITNSKVFFDFYDAFDDLAPKQVNQEFRKMLHDASLKKPLIFIVRPIFIESVKEAIDHDELQFDVEYYALNMDPPSKSLDDLRRITFLTKENLVGVLSQKLPLTVNDPLTRQDITHIRKVMFKRPIKAGYAF